jgi:hypothetical protein
MMRRLVLPMMPVWRRTLFMVAGLLALGAGCLFMSAPAFAEFSRAFEQTLPTGTPTTGEPVGGIAINTSVGGLYGGHTWTGALTSTNEPVIDEFGESNLLIRQLMGEVPPPAPISLTTGLAIDSLAFDDSNGALYTAGLKESVAADNSMDPTRGDIYFAHKGSSTEPGAVVRDKPENEKLESADFSETGCPGAEYIRNGNELIGRPGEMGEPVEKWFIGNVGGVAISGAANSAGDIYVINQAVLGDSQRQIDEFTSSGCFLKVITGRIEVEENGKKEVVELFPLALDGVAIDPTNGDVLVTSVGSGAIDEFSSSGEYLGQISGTSKHAPFEDNFNQNHGIAVSSTGYLYVDVHNEPLGSKAETNVVDVFGPGAFYPDVITGEVTGNQKTAAGEVNATLNGIVNGRGLPLTECYFEYVEAARYEPLASNPYAAGKTAECSPRADELTTSSQNDEVQAEVAHLVSRTIYDYRLIAGTDPSKHGGTKNGENASFAAAAAPSVEDVSVSDISSSYADFSAKINPMGVDTTYRFEYVDAAQYEPGAPDPYANGGSSPIPSADIDSGDSDVNVNVQVGGLSPETTYDYRVVASNEAGTTTSVDEMFSTTQAGAQGPPDGRVYELVTPVNKGDAKDMFGGIESRNFEYGYSSEDGEHFLLWTNAAFGPFPASSEGAYVFSREEKGWSFKSVASQVLGAQAVTDLVFDPWNFSMVGVTDSLGFESERNVGLVGSPSGPYATVGSTTGANELVNLVGASDDLSHVVAESHDHELPLCEGSQQVLSKTLDDGSQGLYEWSAARQCFVCVDLKSRLSSGGLVSRCGAVLGQGTTSVRSGSTHDAVSDDGSKIFFTAPDPNASGPHCWNSGASPQENPPELYMRVNAETTVEVSASEGVKDPTCAVRDPVCHPAVYVGASENGAKVFFITRAELTKDAVEAGTHEPELYEYDTEAPEGKRLVRISRGDLASGPVDGRVLDVPDVSADGSAVYFNAEGNLTPGANGGGLYRYDTETGQTAYVAPVQDYPSEKSVRFGEPGEEIESTWYHQEVLDGLVAGLDLNAEYETTRDGQFLLYGPHRYDATDNRTVCVMCNPDGSGVIPDAGFGRSAAYIANPAGRPPRAMSENGEYVFFDTPESLVPQDTNGKIDIYEWHNGSISLVSSGNDPSNSFFLDSSSYINSKGETVEGGNVFFGTHAKLVAQDTDEEGDLYDARIGGGFAPPAPVLSCEGDACDNPPPLPLVQAPTTLTLASSGNIPASPPIPKKTTKRKVPRCSAPKRLSHGKCVKPRVKKAKSHKGDR